MIIIMDATTQLRRHPLCIYVYTCIFCIQFTVIFSYDFLQTWTSCFMLIRAHLQFERISIWKDLTVSHFTFRKSFEMLNGRRKCWPFTWITFFFRICIQIFVIIIFHWNDWRSFLHVRWFHIPFHRHFSSGCGTHTHTVTARENWKANPNNHHRAPASPKGKHRTDGKNE